MGFFPDVYDLNGNFISRNRLESPLDDLAGYDPLSKNDPKPRYHQNDSLYAPTYTTPIHDRRTNRPLSHTNKVWLSHSRFGVLSPPDSPTVSPPYLSYIDEPWSPASVTTELDDDCSLASSTTSLSPNSDLDTFPGDPAEDENDDTFFSSPAVSPSAEPIYQPLEQYPLHTSPHEHNDYLDDDDLSPLTFSPPSLPPHLLSPSESGHQSSIKNSSTYSPPFQPYNYCSFNYDPSTSVPSSPSRRRSTRLPELESTTFNPDLFGLHKSIPSEESPSPDIDMDMPVARWCSFPGCETDDDLIPMELASKNYIPDPSAAVPTTSAGIPSLLIWDHDHNDRSDMLIPRSPSPETFYLDPTVLAECGDEELQQVYELRQRTAKNEKWERERCRELSALLRLKLDERGVLGSGEGGDCSNHQSGFQSLSCCSNLPFSSSPSSSDSLTVYQSQPSSSSSRLSPVASSTQKSILVPTPSSPSSTLQSTLEVPHAQSQGPKHKIRSMAQLVASMLFHRQSDAMRRHPSRKAGLDSTSSHSSFYSPHPSPMGAGMKVLSTPKSRLSKVILPEELEVDPEEEQGLGVEVETGGEAQEDIDLDDGSLGRSCSDMDLDGEVQMGNSSSHTVTRTAPTCTL